jgi:hypothetical protein
MLTLGAWADAGLLPQHSTTFRTPELRSATIGVLLEFPFRLSVTTNHHRRRFRSTWTSSSFRPGSSLVTTIVLSCSSTSSRGVKSGALKCCVRTENVISAIRSSWVRYA